MAEDFASIKNWHFAAVFLGQCGALRMIFGTVWGPQNDMQKRLNVLKNGLFTLTLTNLFLFRFFPVFFVTSYYCKTMATVERRNRMRTSNKNISELQFSRKKLKVTNIYSKRKSIIRFVVEL